MKQITPTINKTLSVNNFRVVNFEGRPHVAAPVTLLVEGVHSGSNGPLFYPAAELEASAHLWNGEPVPVRHPTANDGTPCSCNSPKIHEDFVIGRVWNVFYDPEQKRLRGEVWLDTAKTKEVENRLRIPAPGILERINADQPIEVSTSLFFDQNEYTEEDIPIVTNIKPDHLAVLPDQIGACSCADGCGIRNNSRGKTDMSEKKDLNILQRALQSLGFSINETSMDAKQVQIRRQLDTMDNGNATYFLRRTFDEYFIYEVMPGPSLNGMGERKLFKQPYTVDDNERVVFDGSPVEVRKEENYPEITGNASENDKATSTNNGQENNKMTDERKASVNKLITMGAFDETDRTALETCSCKMFAEITANKAAVAPVKAVANEEKPSLPQTEAEWLTAMPSNLSEKIAAFNSPNRAGEKRRD